MNKKERKKHNVAFAMPYDIFSINSAFLGIG